MKTYQNLNPKQKLLFEAIEKVFFNDYTNAFIGLDTKDFCEVLFVMGNKYKIKKDRKITKYNE